LCLERVLSRPTFRSLVTALTGSGTGTTFVCNGNESGCILIPGKGRFSIKALMLSPVVVIVDEPGQPLSQHLAVHGWTNIDIFLFECTPEAFYPNVVKRPAFSVHADGDILAFKILYPSWTRKLRALVRVYNLRLAVHGDCFTKHVQAVFGIQRIVNVPANNIPAIYINDSRQVKESFCHWYVRDIDTPYMIRVRNLKTSKSVRLNVFGQPQLTQVPFRINGHDAHFTKQSADTFWACQDTQCTQEINHPQNAFCRMFHVFFVHQAHQFKVCGILPGRLVILHAAIQSE